MTDFQKLIKFLAIAFAAILAVGIIGGILGVIGLFGGLFEESGVLEDGKTYAVSGTVTQLEAEISAADFTIKEADSFSVESNLKNLTVTEKNGTLTIKEKQRFGSTNSDGVLVLYIPADTVFERVSITTGAGRLSADSLSAESLQLELGAGEVAVNQLTATKKADIDGGAGKITVSGGVLSNLDLDMGVGQLNLTSAFHGENELNLGIGESNLTFLGSKAEYSIEVEKGIGGITVNGSPVSSFKTPGNGQREVDINGGIGAINLSFSAQ